MAIIESLIGILLASIVIYYVGRVFAESSSHIGDYLGMPRAVKGATFDAVSSSLPEFLISLFAVISFNSFDVGIGTIAGSALFNLLIIPGISVLVAPVAFKVSKQVITRDAFFYIISVLALLAAVLYSNVWGVGIAFGLFALYIVYVYQIVRHTHLHRRNKEHTAESVKHINIWKELFIFIVGVLIIGVATYYLTESSIEFAHALGVAEVIIAFTVLAAATSVPDAVISITNAKKGDIDDATSNVFGSNIFDILIGLSIPVLIYISINGPLEIIFHEKEILYGLLVATLIVFYFLAESHTLDKKKAWSMIGLYVLFVLYVIYLSLI